VDFRRGRLPVDDPEFGRFEVEGDGFSAAGELSSLVVVPEVQSPLGLSPDQRQQLVDTVADYRQALSAAYEQSGLVSRDSATSARHEAEVHIVRILGEAAAARLKRLSWRILNADALFDAEVADALALLPATRQGLIAARAERDRRARDVERNISGARFTTHEAYADQLLATLRLADETILSVLAPEERRAFDALTAPR
jgi:hypothetical protein